MKYFGKEGLIDSAIITKWGYLYFAIFIVLIYLHATPFYYLDFYWWLDLALARIFEWDAYGINQIVYPFMIICFCMLMPFLFLWDFFLMAIICHSIVDGEYRKMVIQAWTDLCKKSYSIPWLGVLLLIYSFIQPATINLYLNYNYLETPIMIVASDDAKYKRTTHLLSKTINYELADGMFRIRYKDFKNARYNVKVRGTLVSTYSRSLSDALSDWLHGITNSRRYEDFIRDRSVCGYVSDAALRFYSSPESLFEGYKHKLFAARYLALIFFKVGPVFEDLGIHDKECYSKNIKRSFNLMLVTGDVELRKNWFIEAENDNCDDKFLKSCWRPERYEEIQSLFVKLFKHYGCY